MNRQQQDHPEAEPNPAHPENLAKQTWDHEGGSLHPDEMKTTRVELAEPVDRSEHAPTTPAPPAGDVRTALADERRPGGAAPKNKQA